MLPKPSLGSRGLRKRQCIRHTFRVWNGRHVTGYHMAVVAGVAVGAMLALILRFAPDQEIGRHTHHPARSMSSTDAIRNTHRNSSRRMVQDCRRRRRERFHCSLWKWANRPMRRSTERSPMAPGRSRFPGRCRKRKAAGLFLALRGTRDEGRRSARPLEEGLAARC
jgi:hypothetical protein